MWAGRGNRAFFWHLGAGLKLARWLSAVVGPLSPSVQALRGIEGDGLFNWPLQTTAACNISSSPAHFFRTLRKHEQDKVVQNVHIGKDKGNLLSLKLSDVVDCKALIIGPPCQLWAGTGKEEGISDPRADVFNFVINLIIDQSWQGMLLVVLNQAAWAVPFFIWEDCQNKL